MWHGWRELAGDLCHHRDKLGGVVEPSARMRGSGSWNVCGVSHRIRMAVPAWQLLGGEGAVAVLCHRAL